MTVPRLSPCLLAPLLGLSMLTAAAAESPRLTYAWSTDEAFDAAAIPAYGGRHDAVYARIDADLDAHVAHLQRWVRQRSISAQDDGIRDMAGLLADDLRALGFAEVQLVDASMPLGKPRKRASPPQQLLDALEGDYRMPPLPQVSLRQRDGRLYGQIAGQDEFEMAYDDAGDFFPIETDAILRPQKQANGAYGFRWMQMGGVFAASRISGDGDAQQAPTLSEAELAAYAGEYALMPGFTLTVRARGGQLHAQATGQGEFPLDPSGKDTFEAAAFGIELVFKRDGGGDVVALDLHQGGRVLSGPRR
jgi:hypothetical protein